MGTMVGEEYMTVTEAATLLKVSLSPLWRRIDQGVLPAYRIGQRRIRVKKSELGRLITPARQGIWPIPAQLSPLLASAGPRPPIGPR